MLKRLELAATKADLAAVETLLGLRTQDEDPIGHMQFSRRVEDLTRRLEEIESTPATGAEVGLFFGGRPVIGSYGIQAEFAGKAVAEFQTLVSGAYAAENGPLGARGPVPQRDRTQFLLTDVARGSFGFVLRQADDFDLVDSALKNVLDRTIDMIFRVASPDQEAFDALAESVDSRVFSLLRSFFKLLDDAGATLRVVEDRRQFTLQRGEIELGRERTEQLALGEFDETIEGIVYLLPASRRFELHPRSGGDLIRGVVTPDCLSLLTGDAEEVPSGIIGTLRTAHLRVREIAVRGFEPRKSYTLLKITGGTTLTT